MRLLFATLLVFTFAKSSLANEVPQYGFSKAENEFMAEHNGMTAQFDFSRSLIAESGDGSLLTQTNATPYAEYNKAGYLIFSSGTSFASGQIKKGLAENLPAGVKLVVYTQNKSAENVQRIRDRYRGLIDQDRLVVVYMSSNGNGFWARDAVPVPVYRDDKLDTTMDPLFTVVDAVYYHHFEPDEEFQNLFLSELTSHEYYFEGGNFIANSQNECLVVNKTATRRIPDSVFLDHYGCKVLTRLPHVKGIGHADESVKFVDDQTVLTDEPSYIPALEEKGYRVVQLPRPNNEYETYVNSLIINGKVFVPIFKQDKDEEVLQIYRDLGFEAYGFDSRTLSNRGLGSIHCITMTYPEVPMSDLVESMGGQVLQ
jgi:hypothetical protein